MRKKNMLLSLLLTLSLLLGACGASTDSTVAVSSDETQSVTASSSEVLETTSSTSSPDETQVASLSESSSELSETPSPEESEATPSETDQSISGTMSVHFIDVGQADCALIQLPNDEVMLIDAGNNDDADLIVNYLQSLGITTIDYLIGTHPHEDHIGSLDTVIDTFGIENVYMPKATTTTQTFEDVLTAIDNKGLEITTAKAGVELLNYSNLQAVMIAPNSDTYSDLNNYSAVVKLTYGDTSFLFAGDAETESENEMLANGYDLNCDVLKVGHHGSDSSTSEAFLAAASPSIAIISCGLNNSYGHPTDSVLQRLLSSVSAVYRTDLQGTIVVTSDGTAITVSEETLSETEMQASVSGSSGVSGTTGSDTGTQSDIDTQEQTPTETETETESTDTIVYITKTGEKYHTGSCSYLSKSKIETTLESAKARGYTACSKCNPPS